MRERKRERERYCVNSIENHEFICYLNRNDAMTIRVPFAIKRK